MQEYNAPAGRCKRNACGLPVATPRSHVFSVICRGTFSSAGKDMRGVARRSRRSEMFSRRRYLANSPEVQRPGNLVACSSGCGGESRAGARQHANFMKAQLNSVFFGGARRDASRLCTVRVYGGRWRADNQYRCHRRRLQPGAGVRRPGRQRGSQDRERQSDGTYTLQHYWVTSSGAPS